MDAGDKNAKHSKNNCMSVEIDIVCNIKQFMVAVNSKGGVQLKVCAKAKIWYSLLVYLG